MDKALRPTRFDTLPNTTTATKEFKHWLRTFEYYLEVLPQERLDKLRVLTNFVSPEVFEIFSECASYDIAVTTLTSAYIKVPNIIYARHRLATRQQQPGESMDTYLQALRILANDCNFKTVSAKVYQEEAIRDAFISGISSNEIRQRLLENDILTLAETEKKARTFESAQKNSQTYAAPFSPSESTNASVNTDTNELATAATATKPNSHCYFCGYTRHPRTKCPAKDATCNYCGIKGHFAKVCRSATKDSKAKNLSAATLDTPTLASVSATITPALKKSTCIVNINGCELSALIDSGSSDSFIHPKVANKLSLKILKSNTNVKMASMSLSSNITGYCITDVKVNRKLYSNVKLFVMEDLCADTILGLDFQTKHESITINYGGAEPPLIIGGLSTLNVEPPKLFEYLTPDCKPIASKSRKYNNADQKFIQGEVQRLLQEGIIEPSTSPWRAQVVVTKDLRAKKRLVIDYSQTVNRFTQLDAYPLPKIDELVNKMATYRVYSTIDLKSAYHQIPIDESDRTYTAFEADGGLYQFTRVPFGVTNGVPCFQRKMDEYIDEENLQDTFAYLDNITICGRDKAEHDHNLQDFLDAAKRKNLTFNQDKCIFSTTTLKILGSEISNGEIRPDPERLQPLKDLPVPINSKSLKRVLGLFSYYAKWIPKFSEKVTPLSKAERFPLSQEAIQAFERLKSDIEHSVVCAIDESKPFEVETDASNNAIAGILNQEGRPVAFFSRSLSKSELNHPSVEKEACAIIESVRHWRHLLTGRHFKLITDQQSVAFMFNKKSRNKIKNDKISRWNIELSCYSFDIVYRKGIDNVAPDTFSRIYSCAMNHSSLESLHNSLCHPGVTRMIAFVRNRNLPYSVEEVRNVTKQCRICQQCKPQFYKPKSHLIKATHPLERFNIDFKGPIPSIDNNVYFLTIIDEYSRFPFVYPCSRLDTPTVISCLSSLFSLLGMPGYVHSDRGSSFMSKELKDWLHSKGIATSRTTPYNPEGNGQTERYNGIVMKAITLALRSRNLDIKFWKTVLPDALHSIRSLINTTTNETPHERMFKFDRRSATGQSIPSWLTNSDKVLLKRFVRNSKYDPLVDEVDLIEANPLYAHIRYPDGHESTVSLKHLAPCDSETPHQDQQTLEPDPVQLTTQPSQNFRTDNRETIEATPTAPTLVPSEPDSGLRRSQRVRRPPDKLNL